MPDRPQHIEPEAITCIDRIHKDFDGLDADVGHLHRLATLGTMSAGMAHEINNILTPALAYLQLAQAEPEDRELVSKAMEKAVAGIESTTHIAHALLGFAKDDDGPDRSVVREVVSAALDCLARDPRKDGIEIEIDVPDALHVRMRPHALQQVVLNLVLNACAALNGASGRVALRATNDPRGTTRITVKDNGPGIPREIAGRLFEPFVTARTETRKGGGTGLGLAVCRHLIEQAGGTIAVTTAPGEGTSFDIDVPSCPADHAKAS